MFYWNLGEFPSLCRDCWFQEGNGRARSGAPWKDVGQCRSACLAHSSPVQLPQPRRKGPDVLQETNIYRVPVVCQALQVQQTTREARLCPHGVRVAGHSLPSSHCPPPTKWTTPHHTDLER